MFVPYVGAKEGYKCTAYQVHVVAQLKDHDMRPMTIIKALETMLVIVIFMLNLGCHGNHYSLAMDVMIILSIV